MSTPPGSNGGPLKGDDFPNAGAWLRAAREAKGLTVEDVADATRVRADYIQAIEAMDPRRLPEGPYTIGFVRTLATYLGLHPDDVVTGFREEVSPRRSRRPPPAAKEPLRIAVPPRLILGAGVVIGAGGLLWLGLQPQGGAPENAVPPVPEALREWVATEPGGAAARRALADLEAVEGPAIGFLAHIPAELEIRGPDGRVVYSGVVREGEIYVAPKIAGLTANARNAGAFEVMRDEASAGRLGASGVPVSGWSLDKARKPEPVAAPVIPIPPPPPPPPPPAAPVTRPSASLPESRIIGELPPARPRDEPAPAEPVSEPVSGPATDAAQPAVEEGPSEAEIAAAMAEEAEGTPLVGEPDALMVDTPPPPPPRAPRIIPLGPVAEPAPTEAPGAAAALAPGDIEEE